MKKAIEILCKGNYKTHGKEIDNAIEYLNGISHECFEKNYDFYEIWNDEDTEYIGFGIGDDVYYFSDDIKEVVNY